MVSSRCIALVNQKLNLIGLDFISLHMGEIKLEAIATYEQISLLKTVLEGTGLELIENRHAVLIESIKNTVREYVHQSDDQYPKFKSSQYIQQKLGYNYTYLANIFSEHTGGTIEHFIIAHKIESVKAFLLYDELTLTEIAYKMSYSSPAHLSHQFKRTTGFTPSAFKKLKEKSFSGYDNV